MTTADEAFDAEAFREDGHALIDKLASHLAKAHGRDPSMKVLPTTDPNAMVAAFPPAFDGGGRAALHALVDKVIAQSNHLHHPRYVGHQVTSPLPSSALAELVAAFLNNGSAVYEMGPVSTAMERTVLRFFGARLGFGDSADGVLTSGGSAGNLTALLAMRQKMAGFDIWRDGNHAGPPLAVLASDQTHYCVKRSVQIMGWGEAGVGIVPTDGAYRMRIDALDSVFDATTKSGRRVVGVVASAGSTSTGAVDPLDAVADFCARRGLWLHVDGAHGGSLALATKHRALLNGIERADSVVWDAHKMMLVPALITAVVFRDARRSYEAFSQEASYLFGGNDPEAEWFNVGMRTLECTKRMMGFCLYTALAVHGTAMLGAYVDGTLDLARRFGEMVRAARDFELAVTPDLNIVCFRYVPASVDTGDARDALQTRIRAAILESGAFYLVQTRLRTGVFLRVTLINPKTTEDDLVELLKTVRAVGDAINRKSS